MWQFIRRCLIGGLLVWLPLWATLLIIKFIVNGIDNTFSLLPSSYRPDSLIGFHVPGLGLVIAILILFFTGLLVSNFIGKRLVELWEAIFARIPFVRTIYSGIKQVLQTVLIPNNQSFRKVVLIKFPHQEMYTIAFLVGPGLKEANHVLDKELLTVFVPTTPNPTSGYLVMVEKGQISELDMSVDEALKLVISLGVVQPTPKKL